MTSQPDWGQSPQKMAVSPTLPAHEAEEMSPPPCAHAKAPAIQGVLLGSAAFVVCLVGAESFSS